MSRQDSGSLHLCFRAAALKLQTMNLPCKRRHVSLSVCIGCLTDKIDVPNVCSLKRFGFGNTDDCRKSVPGPLIPADGSMEDPGLPNSGADTESGD